MRVCIYGFGSFFKSISPNDIDILIIHKSINSDSCFFAISCKEFLRLNIDNAHITILSVSEEKQFNFLKKTEAIFLGSIAQKSFDDDIEKIISALYANNGNSRRIPVHFRKRPRLGVF